MATSDGEFVKREGRSKFYEPETLSQASVETEVAEYPTTTGSKDLAGNSNSNMSRNSAGNLNTPPSPTSLPTFHVVCSSKSDTW